MKSSQLKILFTSSEVFPLIKTGGLADVSSGLPLALHKLGQDVRIILPAYKTALEKAQSLGIKLRKLKTSQHNILEGHLPNSTVPVWLVDISELYYRNNGPYGAKNGIDWPDNDERFAIFSDICIQIAMDNINLNWKPDVVHSNDWQTGLIPAKLSLLPDRPATVFTIHNLAYFGLFPRQTFEHLELPKEWWAWDKLEFHNQTCFIKGGLVFADYINTVSPTYANEIRTSEFAYGLEGLLDHRGTHLSGILNGIDYDEWNPETDPHLAKNYSLNTLHDKAENKRELQRVFDLPQREDTLLIGIIGRIVEQKGFDLVLQSLPAMMQHDIQLVMLGSGDKNLENALLENSKNHPNQCAVKIGYNEPLAHLIEGGSDCFMMPSRFEPCGLNQFYSLRYGTVPIVHHTGGLADSVVDTNEHSLEDNSATGFKFYQSNSQSLLQAFYKAQETYQNHEDWQKLIKNGMSQDFSWSKSAQNYLSLYRKAIKP